MEHFYVANSPHLFNQYDGKTVDEIVAEFDILIKDIKWFRNTLGLFWGDLIFSKGNSNYHFDMSQKIIHSAKLFLDTEKLVAKSFKWPVTNSRYLDRDEKENQGLIICEANEEVKPIEKLIFPSDVPLITQKFEQELNGKTFYDAITSRVVDQVEEIDNSFIFYDESKELSFIVINAMKVYLSKGASVLTLEQFAKCLDEMIFYSGETDSGNSWFRLGLPFSYKLSSKKSAINI